jgi:serine phosphatase RsbU (regulator of sigma subunit)
VVECLREQSRAVPQDALDHLHARLKEFVGEEPIEDDLTLLLAEFS